MTERKVINKYYPPDFDPSKLPRLKLSKNRQFNVRIMAPCNMKCNTCGEYIYKGKKFNSRQETVDGETYIGLRIYRFYIKCPRCMSEITFKTNLVEMDYDLENGATRNFQAVRLAEMEADRQEEAKLEEEKSNPMIALERRTEDSRREMDKLEQLEELRDLNMRQATVDHDEVIRLALEKEVQEAIQQQRNQDEEDEAFVRSVFTRPDGPVIKRLRDADDDSDNDSDNKLHRLSAPLASTSATGLLSSDDTANAVKKMKLPDKKPEAWERSIGSSGAQKSLLSSLVRPKAMTASSLGISRPSMSAAGPSSSSVLGSSVTKAAPSGLGLLSNQYGSSSSDDDDN
ncbi:Coiled-coil domain-containing protein 94 [Hypsibius exemplaris]|uniref:Splicing factor YJU2 n=1 Tax=Hypsibius exemplaris TaxID=2072580 RepID=A0A1W0WSW4_HYPEX|nr:Coiled-coil domain-containing protein 94 [Hypsibius exemplaris]